MYLILLITPSGNSPALFISSVTDHTAARIAHSGFSTSLNASMKKRRSFSSFVVSLYGWWVGVGTTSVVFSASDMVVVVGVNSLFQRLCPFVRLSTPLVVPPLESCHQSHLLVTGCVERVIGGCQCAN